MKIYKTQQEVEADIVDNVLTVQGDVTFECSISIEAKIVIEAGDIKAWNIKAWNINAGNINAGNINAGNINAGNINAGNINAGNINAWNINAGNINAWDINFYAVCFAYIKFTCKSIKGRRENSKYFCLDSEVVVSESSDIK